MSAVILLAIVIAVPVILFAVAIAALLTADWR